MNIVLGLIHLKQHYLIMRIKTTYLVLFFLAMLLHLSCKNSSSEKDSFRIPENSKRINLQLIDSLGVVSFAIPGEYDTTFSWIHEGDCGKPCDEQKYRFQSKKLPIIMEQCR